MNKEKKEDNRRKRIEQKRREKERMNKGKQM
jgi:hypothetical protein